MATLDWSKGPGEEPDVPSAETVRRRLVVALAVIFVSQIVLWTALSSPEGGAAALDLELAILRIAVIGVGLPILMVVLARRILEPAEHLEAARDHFKQQYDRARLTALLDPLTGLGNHRAFQEEMSRQAAESQRTGAPLALLLLDLDDLKRVNHERGHAGGDGLLSDMGRLIAGTIRQADRGFRIGGDEFAVLMPHTDTIAAYALGRRLLAASVDGSADPRARKLSFSGGISGMPEPSPDGTRMFRQADAALYWCKRHGRTDIQVFDPQRHGAAGDARTTPELAAGIGKVAEQRLLRPVYQPIYSLTTGLPIGFEGLVRPTKASGFRDAENLFSSAEVTGHTVELDMACIEVVAAHATALDPTQYLAVNISPRTMETDQFHAADLIAIFRANGLDPHRVVLELTERETIEDMARLRESVAACRAAGFRIAADDVGAGNAGLRLLSQIRFDIVKIDLSLVQVGVLEESSRAVLRALRDLADGWDATIVAEGVETPTQLEVVRNLGMNAAQGFLLGRPGDAPAADALDIETLAEGVRWRSELVPVGAE